MAQITEDFARRILQNFERGVHSPLTCWEEAQLAWTWLKHNGHSVPERLDRWGPWRSDSAPAGQSE